MINNIKYILGSNLTITPSVTITPTSAPSVNSKQRNVSISYCQLMLSIISIFIFNFNTILISIANEYIGKCRQTESSKQFGINHTSTFTYVVE